MRYRSARASITGYQLRRSATPACSRATGRPEPTSLTARSAVPDRTRLCRSAWPPTSLSFPAPNQRVDGWTAPMLLAVAVRSSSGSAAWADGVDIPDEDGMDDLPPDAWRLVSVVRAPIRRR